MDDLNQLLGIKYTAAQQATLKELARRANDTLRVFNPLKDDYFVLWGIADGTGGRFRVPGCETDMGYGLGQAVYPRYIVFKFFKEIANIILSAQMKQAIDTENERRRLSALKPMDKTAETVEELSFSAPYMPNNPDKLLELLPKIILGIEREWGMDTLPASVEPDRINWENVMNIINRPASGQGRETPPIAADVTTISEDVLKGVAQQ